jgi:hypothetical protein
MPYVNGKVDMKGYGATTGTMKPVMKDSLASKRKNLAKKKAKPSMVKPIGSIVLSPDQQEKTMTMGKQPIKVYP